MSDPLTTSHDISDVLDAINREPDPTGDPVADEFWSGAQDYHSAADIPTPDEPPPTSTPTPKSEGAKVSVASKGMTAEGLRKSRGLFGEADARAAGQVDELARERDAQAEQSRGHYDALAAGYDLEKQKTREFADEEVRLNQGLVDFHSGAAQLEQRLAGEAQAERQQYLTAYKEQLAGVRALAAQSGNPIGQLSGAQAFGLAGAQFAQGFLATRGVNIDVAGQVDRWVDRSIQEHQQKIQNARASAEDQLHLYEIARQNSQDEWEARQRYRGFVIAGLQASIHLNASRFQSDVAMAHADQQNARLQIEADTTERQMADAYHQRVASVYKAEYDRAFQMGQLAREDQRIALERKRQEWEQDERNPKNIKKAADQPTDFKIADPEPLMDEHGKPVVVNGKPAMVNRWRVDPQVAATDSVAARELFQKGDEARRVYSDYLKATNRMMDAYRGAKQFVKGGGPVNWELMDRMDTTGKVGEFLRARDAWVMSSVYNESGKAVTVQEFERKEKQAYIDKFLARNGDKSEQSFAQLRTQGRGKFESNMESSGFVEIPETDQNRYRAFEGASPVSAAQDEAAVNGKKAVPGFADVETARVVAKGAGEARHTDGNVSGTWADFQNYDPTNLKKAASDEGDTGKYARDRLSEGQPEHSTALELLAAAVVHPHHFYQRASEYGVKIRPGNEDEAVGDSSPAEVRRESYDALKRIAAGDAPGKMPAGSQEYAQFLLDKIDNDPALSAVVKGGSDEDVKVEDSPFAQRLRWRP